MALVANDPPSALVANDSQVPYTVEQWHTECARLTKIALKAVEEIAKHKDSPTARIAAARTLLEVTGIIGSGRHPAPRQERDPAAMSVDELKALVARFDGEIAARATLVEPTKPSPEVELFDNVEQSSPK